MASDRHDKNKEYLWHEALSAGISNLFPIKGLLLCFFTQSDEDRQEGFYTETYLTIDILVYFCRVAMVYPLSSVEPWLSLQRYADPQESATFLRTRILGTSVKFDNSLVFAFINLSFMHKSLLYFLSCM